ncbi:type II secretion system protein GspK [Urbifossiella limnaea]|uniref:General secretion pathway protein K n=1 Tax=Urbifossiella limnaea TaxID=2528023 RepID=A0A517XL09_9BACT|nr:type II secretion system protein GspK [Urbifossiella limnaea]QDU18202.1 General secretion pathway protein K [Urbifossiella limnaea]
MRLRRPAADTGRRAPRRGFVIVAVLIVVVVLSLAAYRFTDLMTAEYRAAARSQDSAQARAAARSGVHYAAAMLSDPSILNGELGGNPYADGAFYPQLVRDGGVARQVARFVLVAVLPDGNGGYEQRYGCVIDEASRLNINTLIQLDDSGQLLYDALMKLPNMTEDVAAAVVDWVDPDDDPREGGAESDYYLGLGQPYRCKNGPLNSVEELLFVRGVTPQVLYGSDRNRNGVADDDGSGGTFDRGLADFLTVYGREINTDSQGQLRTNVNEADDLPGLYQKLTARLPQELADFIMAYKMFGLAGTNSRGGTTAATVAGGPAEVNAAVTLTLETLPVNKRRITNFLDLVTARVTLPRVPGAPADTPQMIVSSPLADPDKFAAMFGELMDKATTTTNVELTPRINLNTAPREVLMAVPNMTEEEADAIIAQRDALNPTDPGTVTGAWVVTSGAVSQATYRRIGKYVTGRTMVYRIQAVGYFGSGGPVARAEAVIDINQGAPRTLYFRDLTDLDTPRGFEPPR